MPPSPNQSEIDRRSKIWSKLSSEIRRFVQERRWESAGVALRLVAALNEARAAEMEVINAFPMPPAFKRAAGYPQFLAGQKDFQAAQELIALVAKGDFESLRFDRVADLQKQLAEARKLLASAHSSCGEIFPVLGAIISYQLAVLALVQRDFPEAAKRTQTAISHVRFVAQANGMIRNREFRITRAIGEGREKEPMSIKVTNQGAAETGYTLGFATIAIATKLRLLLVSRRARAAWSIFSSFETVVDALDKICLIGFVIPCRTTGSEEVRVVGSCLELGAWSLRRGVPLNSRDGLCSAALPIFFDTPDQALEYKYVAILGNSTRWESGPNHRAAPGNKYVTLCEDQWQI